MPSPKPSEANRTDSPIPVPASYVRRHTLLLGIGIILIGLATFWINSQLLARTLDSAHYPGGDMVVEDAALPLFLVSHVLTVFGFLILLRIRWFILGTPVACVVGLAFTGLWAAYNLSEEIYCTAWMGGVLALGLIWVFTWSLLVRCITRREDHQTVPVGKIPSVELPLILYQGQAVNAFLIWAHERRQWLLSWSWSILGVLLIAGTIPAAIFLPEEGPMSLSSWLFVFSLEGMAVGVSVGLFILARLVRRGSATSAFVSLGLAYLIPVLGLLFQVAFGNSGMLTDAACCLLLTSLAVGGYFIVLTHSLLWVRRKMTEAQLPLHLRIKDLRGKNSDQPVLKILAPTRARISRIVGQLLWLSRWYLVAGATVCLVLLGIRAWNTNERVPYLEYLDHVDVGIVEARHYPLGGFLEHFVGMQSVLGVYLNTHSIGRDKLATCPPLSKLKLLPELETVTLSGQLVTDDDLAVIGALRRLRILNLRGTPITNESLQLITRLGKLEVLDVSATGISDAAVDSLSRLQNLTELRIEDSDITPAGVEQLKSLLPRTRIVGRQTPSSAHRQTIVDLLSRGATCYYDDRNELHILVHRADGGDRGVPRISELRRPHVLGLSDLDISPWLKEIGDDDNLTRLELNSCQMSGTALKSLSNAKGLRQLSVQYDFAKEIFGELRHLPKFEVLAVGGRKLQPGDWDPIGELRELRELTVSGCAFADADLAVLRSNGNLRRLDISSSQISEQGIGRLPDFCPQLEWLKLDSLLLTDDAVERLRGLSKLKELRIVPHRPEVTDLTLLRAKLPGCKIEFHYGYDGRS